MLEIINNTPNDQLSYLDNIDGYSFLYVGNFATIVHNIIEDTFTFHIDLIDEDSWE